MSTLNKQVWIAQIMEKYYPEASFLTHAKDFSQFVDNDIINLAEAGVDPDVLVNNTAYPINVVERTDSPLGIELDLFETENTLIRRPHTIELAYDKLESVVMGHRNSLRAKTSTKAAHAFAPQSNTVNTPILETTGDNDGEGNKRLIPENILKLKRKYDDLDYPLDKRFLILDPRHVEDLLIYDLKLFKDIVDLTNGQPKRFAGFNILQFTKNPLYTSANEKKPWGSAAVPTDKFSSFSFYGDEVMRAVGSMHMYATENDAKERGTIVGFDMRFIGMPIRNKGIGSILSGKI
ncbi:hypothetical protein ACR79B_15785 [Sphingobacterium spiritivorum]|uniref:hypothetical protein n=1 Tax=Sphingobacterium spiritivorum TaxID=258 RepID=UPI003DA4F2A2